MAEVAVLGLASKVLSTMASLPLEAAYERGLSIWEAKDELKRLQETIESIQHVLPDAEKQGSTRAKDWIKRLKGVLYDAEDLFDKVATDDELKQQIKGSDKLFIAKEVQVCCSKLNPIVFRDSVARKVKAIRKRMSDISTDMAALQFVPSFVSGEEIPNGVDPGSYIDPKDVYGRYADQKAITEMLFNPSTEPKPDVPIVIAVVGIGGMGKTALSQLIFNDKKVKQGFNNTWFASIRNTSDDKEVIGKIFQSMYGENYSDLSVGHLQTKIRESVEDKKILLVLDDVWDQEHGRWQDRMKLLSGSSNGSRIIVTTRFLAVAEAVDPFKIHPLRELLKEDAWNLFKRVAFAPGKENDPTWMQLGEEIVKKCAGVPLAIKSIGSLLYRKTNIQEWRSIRDQELSKLDGQSDSTSILPVLKLSYDHLPSNLKQCFAYCSLFPKDYVFDVQKLIYLWFAQGYIAPNEEGNSIEDVGRSYFTTLLRMCFFCEPEEDDFGEICCCKMLDVVHELAKLVAGDETVVLAKPSSQFYNSARHVSVGYGMDNAGKVLQHKLNMSRLRSFMLTVEDSRVLSTLHKKLRFGKCLRALNLSDLGIVEVPVCIGELKLLRYLDLSWNRFERLPDSMANLLNLLALDLLHCSKLMALPYNFRKLINLRHLNIRRCKKLKHMPPGFGELSSLQYLTDFKVGEATSKVEGVENQSSGLEALAGLVQLRGMLTITIDERDGNECTWKLSFPRQELEIQWYPDRRIPHCESLHLLNLGYVKVKDCPRVEYLPPFRYLRNLKSMCIDGLSELEYMEEEIVEGATGSVFFPSLEHLELLELPKLKGWWRKRKSHHVPTETSTTGIMEQQQQLLSFPLLSELWIKNCPDLKQPMPSAHICHLRIHNVVGEVIEKSLSSTSLKQLTIRNCKGPISFPSKVLASLQTLYCYDSDGLQSLHLASPHLMEVSIINCNGLTRVQVEAPATSLCSTSIVRCSQLHILHIARPNVLEELVISECPKLELRSVDWYSLPNLRWVQLDFPLEELPKCLVRRQALTNLQINRCRGNGCNTERKEAWEIEIQLIKKILFVRGVLKQHKSIQVIITIALFLLAGSLSKIVYVL